MKICIKAWAWVGIEDRIGIGQGSNYNEGIDVQSSGSDRDRNFRDRPITSHNTIAILDSLPADALNLINHMKLL